MNAVRAAVLDRIRRSPGFAIRKSERAEDRSALPRNLLALGLTIIVAGILRLVALADVPPGLFIDEVWSSFGPALFHGGGNPADWPLPITIAQLSSGQLFFSGLAEGSAFWTRFSTALLGIAAVPLIYSLTRLWFSPGTALLAAVSMALAPWALQLSRYAVPGMALVVWTLAFVVCLETLLARRSAGWLVGVTASAILLLGSHAVASIFLPLLGLGYLLLRRKEVLGVLRTLSWPSTVALLIVAAYIPLQVLPILESEGPSAIQSSLLSNLAFARPEPPAAILWGIIERYIEHWTPSFLFLRGDPDTKYSIGMGGELFVLGPFVYLGLLVAWTRRRLPHWRTLLWWAAAWPVPSALVVPDNPNAIRSATGMPLLIILGVVGLEFAAAWAANTWGSRRLFARLGTAALAAMLALGFAFTVSFYFLTWPGQPGVARAFQYGYDEVELVLRTRTPRKVVVAGDVWRSADFLRFYGLRWPAVSSIAPGMPLHFDLFQPESGYLITSDARDASELQANGYRARLLEVVKTPIDEPHLWVYRIGRARVLVPVRLASVAFSRPSPRYGHVAWDPLKGRIGVASVRIFDDRPAVGYAVYPRPFFGAMQMTATVNLRKGLPGDVFMGYSSYRDPALGAPDDLSPFMGVFFRIAPVNGGWRVIAEDRSVDSRTISRRLGQGSSQATLRVTYSYLSRFRATFEIRRSGQWRTLLVVRNYVKQPLYPFVGLLSDEPAAYALRIRAIATTGGGGDLTSKVGGEPHSGLALTSGNRHIQRMDSFDPANTS